MRSQRFSVVAHLFIVCKIERVPFNLTFPSQICAVIGVAGRGRSNQRLVQIFSVDVGRIQVLYTD